MAFLGFTTRGQKSKSLPDTGGGETFAAVDEYVTAKMQAARIPGLALGIVKGDRIVYLKGYGRADSSRRPVTPQTPFIIGSITKSFTALAVLQLVEAGKVELEAPVTRYIPGFRTADPQASAQITLRQLLNQTSGLPQIYETQLWTWQDEGALERAVRFLKGVKMNRLPGEGFGYSNANYETLGLIVQTVSGQSYENYIRQSIFAPLDMQNSFAIQEEAMRHGLASGHRWWFGLPIPVNLPHNRAGLPGGYLISSAEDMARFLMAQMNGGRYRDISVLSPEGIALMQTEPVANTYAMGWETVRIDGRTLINHDGGTANFQGSVFFDPEERVGVVLFANVMSALDAFSSPPGSTPLDGITTRVMARSVLNLVTSQPLPEQGPGNGRLYLIFDLLLLALTIPLVRSLAELPERRKRLAQHRIARWSGFVRHSGRLAFLHFTWPASLLYLARKVPAWKVMAVFQPDLDYWLKAVALVLSIKGLLEIALGWRLFRQTRRN